MVYYTNASDGNVNDATNVFKLTGELINMKAILENVKIGVQMILIGALLLFTASTIFMPELTIKIFGFQPFVVVTESMEPYINVNDAVVATRFNIDKAEVGDIITFNADIDYNGTEETVTHYIYSIEGEGTDAVIRTNRHFEEGETVVPDTWLLETDDVIGSYSFQVKYLGYVTGFIKSIYGIAVIAINLVIFGAIKYVNYRSDKKQEQEANTETQKLNDTVVIQK